MKKYAVLISAFLLLFCGTTYGETDEKLFKLTTPDSLDSMLKNYILKTRSQTFEDPKVPRFLISDRNDSFFFGVGGYVGAKLFGDWNGNRTPGFTTDYNGISSFDNAVMELDLSSTTLLFNVVGQTKIGYVDAVIEANFKGENRQMKLSKAYLDFVGVRIGIAPTVFHDREQIDLIDGNQYFSDTKRSVPMVGYIHYFDKLSLQGSLEFPQTTTSYIEEIIEEIDQPASNISLSADYTTDRFHVYGGTQFGFIQYSIPSESKMSYIWKPTCSFQLSGNCKTVKNAVMTQTLFLQGVWTLGMPDCMTNLANRGLNVVVSTSRGEREFIIPKAIGAHLGYQFKWGSNGINLQTSADYVYGHEKADIKELHKWGYAASVNYIRDILKYATVGAEIIYGANHSLEAKRQNNWRTYIYIRYNF